MTIRKSIPILVLAILWHARPGAAGEFRRADSDGDGVVTLADAVATLGYLFLGAASPRCEDASDANDDGEIDIVDASATLSFLFLGTAPPSSPGPSLCGVDPTGDELGCGIYEPRDERLRCPANDLEPPRVTALVPSEGAVTGDLQVIRALFSEVVEASTLGESSFRLVASGGDGVAGTSEDEPVPGGRVVHRPGIQSVFLAFATPLPPARYRVVIGPGFTDRAGNVQSETYSSSFRNGQGTTLSGRVTAGGESVVGARLTALLQSELLAVATGETGADGAFSLHHVPADFGPLTVRIEATIAGVPREAEVTDVEPIPREETSLGTVDVLE